MKTKRRQSRKNPKKPKRGGNWFTKKLRNVGIYSNLSTSEIADKINYIRKGDETDDVKHQYINHLFDEIGRDKIKANYTNILRDLKKNTVNDQPFISYITQQMVGLQPTEPINFSFRDENSGVKNPTSVEY
jgi:hypothetical protein